MVFGNKKYLPEVLKEIAGTSLTGSYQNVGSVTSNSWRVCFIKNNTDKTIYVSWDGALGNNHKMAAGQSQSIDFSTNSLTSNTGYLAAGTQFSAKHAGVVPTTGDVVIEGIFG